MEPDDLLCSCNARLVLLLANHIGALEVLRQALRAARRAHEGATPLGGDS